MRFLIFNAFAGGMYLQSLNQFMACVTIEYKILAGHLYFVMFIDDETFKYRIAPEPEAYWHWKRFLELLPKPMSVQGHAASKHDPASVFDKGKCKVSEWFAQGVTARLDA